ncbi:MAG: GNAT family N-acetyltransferase [Chloroflexota bacterium]
MGVVNSAPCQHLPWDTDFWGFRVARLDGGMLSPPLANAVDAWCGAEGVRCLYFLARPDDYLTTCTAADRGYRLVDIRLTLRNSTLATCFDAPPGVRVRLASPADLPALRSIALDNYQDTRFHYDTNFPRKSCRALYETWITVSLEGYAQAVLVAEWRGEAAGYLTCHVDSPAEGRIGLVGVAGGAQQHGLGHALVRSALLWFGERGIGQVSVVTQGRNCAAQRLYQRCGFVTKELGLWYHKWYADEELSDGHLCHSLQ